MVNWWYANITFLRENVMRPYSERLRDARVAYANGKKRAKTGNPKPPGQKFAIGDRVRIAEDLGPMMRHFSGSGQKATVEYTYGQAYGGDVFNEYSLKIDGRGSSSWYGEHQLTLLRTETALVSILRAFSELRASLRVIFRRDR